MSKCNTPDGMMAIPVGPCPPQGINRWSYLKGKDATRMHQDILLHLSDSDRMACFDDQRMYGQFYIRHRGGIYERVDPLTIKISQ